VQWPLSFRAFGDYKNPVYIYILAGVFRLTGPGILVPRLLSAIVVILAGATLGLLAFRLSRSRIVGLLTGIFALITPWLFEVGHVAMELALYPLACGLFLLAAQRAGAKSKWSATDVLALAATLALLTYGYSIGRLFGPLVAVGLAFFWNRKRWPGVVAAWGLYALLVLPIAVFAFRHPGALVARFTIITYLNSDLSLVEVFWEFGKHYLANLNPWRLLVTGDPSPDQIVHVFGTPHFLAPIFALSIIGVAVALRQARREPWSRFLLYAFAVSIVPASLTNEPFHMLRLVAMPVFLIVFAIQGLIWFAAGSKTGLWRTAFVILLASTAIEAAWFQWNYHRTAKTARRVHLFDAEYPTKIFAPAVASSAYPIHLADALWIPGYIQAYWYGTLHGIDLSRFRLLPPNEPVPLGGLVISTEENCPGCEVLASAPPYTLAIARESPRPRTPLPREAMRAELSVIGPRRSLRAKERTEFFVQVRNVSPIAWLARERGGGA